MCPFIEPSLYKSAINPKRSLRIKTSFLYMLKPVDRHIERESALISSNNKIPFTRVDAYTQRHIHAYAYSHKKKFSCVINNGKNDKDGIENKPLIFLHFLGEV